MATQKTALAEAAFSDQPWLLTNRRTAAANPTPTRTANVTHRSSHDRDLRPTPTTSAASARTCNAIGTKPLVSDIDAPGRRFAGHGLWPAVNDAQSFAEGVDLNRSLSQ